MPELLPLPVPVPDPLPVPEPDPLPVPEPDPDDVTFAQSGPSDNLTVYIDADGVDRKSFSIRPERENTWCASRVTLTPCVPNFPPWLKTPRTTRRPPAVGS